MQSLIDKAVFLYLFGIDAKVVTLAVAAILSAIVLLRKNSVKDKQAAMRTAMYLALLIGGIILLTVIITVGMHLTLL
jgi:hypothetical protein